MTDFLQNVTMFVPSLLVGVCVLCAGLLGYAIARLRHEEVETDQDNIMRSELARQRRRSVAADGEVRKLRAQVEKSRRRLPR